MKLSWTTIADFGLRVAIVAACPARWIPMIAISQAVCVLGVLGLAAVGLKIARPARRGVARPAVVELTGIQVPIDSIQIVVIHCSRDDCQNSELRPLGNLAEDFEKSGWRLFDGKWRCPCCNGLRSAAT